MLNISRCKVTVIENLDSLKNLRELQLWGNKIEKIENLNNQSKLETLSLSDNQIAII